MASRLPSPGPGPVRPADPVPSGLRPTPHPTAGSGSAALSKCCGMGPISRFPWRSSGHLERVTKPRNTNSYDISLFHCINYRSTRASVDQILLILKPNTFWPRCCNYLFNVFNCCEFVSDINHVKIITSSSPTRFLYFAVFPQ